MIGKGEPFESPMNIKPHFTCTCTNCGWKGNTMISNNHLIRNSEGKLIEEIPICPYCSEELINNKLKIRWI